MANANWSNPTLTSTYTNFITEVKSRDEDLAKQFDGFSGSNQVTGTIKWDSTANHWKKWSGSSWGELTSIYKLSSLEIEGTSTFKDNVTIEGTKTLDVGGAVTAASFAPDSSTAPSNGLSLSAANQLLFSTNGNPRLTIASDGDIGVNDTTPSSKLDVNGGIKAKGGTSGDVGYTFNSEDTDGGMFSPDNNTVQFRTNNSPRLTIVGSNVGIGDTTPDELLHVHNAATTATTIKISNTEGNVFIRADGDEANYDADGHRFRNESGSTIARIDTANTRLGIGTASPSETLHVDGTSKFTGVITADSGVDGNATTATDLAINATHRLLTQTANNATSALAAGSSGQFLKSNGSGTAPSWTSISLDGDVPIGGIIMWNGTEANIPSNYKFCDGNNGTPDLRNKFIIAANDYDSNWRTNITGSNTQSGGDKDAVVVDHGHGDATSGGDNGDTESAGSHSHNITDPGHDHDYVRTIDFSSGGGDASNRRAPYRDDTRDTGDKTTGITIDSGGAHSHVIKRTGVSGTNANLPPYFALAFIMRAS